jgi:hypothetical protein
MTTPTSQEAPEQLTIVVDKPRPDVLVARLAGWHRGAGHGLADVGGRSRAEGIVRASGRGGRVGAFGTDRTAASAGAGGG